jgi:hypothetical protein
VNDHDLKAKIERIERVQRFIFHSLCGQINVVATQAMQANARLLGLAVILNRKGLEVTEEELTAAVAEILAAKAVDEAFDPRPARLEALFKRLMQGEVPDGEFDRLLQEAMEPQPKNGEEGGEAA